MIKTTPLIPLFFLPFLSLGQVAVVHHFSISGVPDQHAIKYAHQVVLDLDPQATLSFDADMLKIRTASASGSELLSALNSTGAAIYHLEIPVERSSTEVPASFPVLVGTGDPEADLLRYQTAKQQWVATHPQEYQEMTRSSEGHEPSTAPR
ncbi:MAG: hypothetical protein IPL52_17920 [Flavobacteriales bacterium]|nr:hypothetical protein [Flavobacteriales bacterium]